MASDRKRELRYLYDQTAVHYDQRYADTQRRKYLALIPELPDGKVALDLGCGTGMFMEELEKRYEVVVGADISMEMLRLAKQRAEKSSLILGDADQLPFIGNCFDVVVSVTLLQNLPDPMQGLREIRRVIKTAGTLLLTALRRRFSTGELQKLVQGAGFTVMKIGEIAGSEDVFCVARVHP